MTLMNYWRFALLAGCITFLNSCAKHALPVVVEGADPKTKAVQEHRLKTHEVFLSDKSPLMPKEKKKFSGLNYYPIDTAYYVTAKFIRTPNAELFKMKTTTTRLPDYRKYADVVFTLQGIEYKLEVYQSPDLMKKAEYADHLFIPFTDETNGKETYDVGRYLELHIPEGDVISLDFNMCYNPYCSYSPNYSCPIPPAVNHLPIEVKAGEKKYH